MSEPSRQNGKAAQYPKAEQNRETKEHGEQDAEEVRLAERALFERRERTEQHSSYMEEKKRYHMIRNGQTDQLEELLNQESDGTPGTLSKDRLRSEKNMFIAGITLYTRAAMDGGLPEETAYAMSDGYILKAEECTGAKEIEQLHRKAVREFARAVARNGKKHYSVYVEKAMHYIHIHLHGEIRLEQAAAAAGISPCHLSHLFREETGMTLVDYVQKERVDAARNMLVYSDYTATEISQYLCFSTQSYFIRIFKKYVGMTPSRYRKYYRAHENW